MANMATEEAIVGSENHNVDESEQRRVLLTPKKYVYGQKKASWRKHMARIRETRRLATKTSATSYVTKAAKQVDKKRRVLWWQK